MALSLRGRDGVVLSGAHVKDHTTFIQKNFTTSLHHFKSVCRVCVFVCPQYADVGFERSACALAQLSSDNPLRERCGESGWICMQGAAGLCVRIACALVLKSRQKRQSQRHKYMDSQSARLSFANTIYAVTPLWRHTHTVKPPRRQRTSFVCTMYPE